MKIEPSYQHIPTFYASSAKVWRNWLQKNHQQKLSVWLVIFKKGSGIPSVYYDEAVNEALCFGWIDSKPNKRNAESYYQFFSKRNPKSNWSKVNKNKVEQLLKLNKIEPAGMAMIELAKQTGTWDSLNLIDALQEPQDLMEGFIQYPDALKFWELFPPSTRRGILEWIQNAKKAETRAKRIAETILLASQNKRANQFIRKST